MKVRKYDPVRDAYYTIDIKKLKKEILSMGFSEEEAIQKVEERIEEVFQEIANALNEDVETIKTKLQKEE